MWNATRTAHRIQGPGAMEFVGCLLHAHTPVFTADEKHKEMGKTSKFGARWIKHYIYCHASVRHEQLLQF
jgi:hypothetical protein